MPSEPTPSDSSHPAATSGQPTQRALLLRMLALAWQYRLGCLRVLAQQGLLVWLGLLILQLTGVGIDSIRHVADPVVPAPRWPGGWSPPTHWEPTTTILVLAGTIFTLALLAAWVRYRAAVLVADLTQRIVVRLRADVYGKLQQLSFRFYDRHESGSIINRVTADVQAVRLFVDGVIIQVVVASLSLLVYLSYMLQLHVPLTIACLATTPLLGWLAARSSRQLHPLYQRNRELADQLVRTLSENVQGVLVVKGFGREDEEIAKFTSANARIQDGKREVFWRLSLFQPLVGGLTQVNLLILLGYGGWLVMHDQLPLGEGLFVFAQLLQQFATQIGQIANVSNSIQSSISGAQRVFEVLDAPVEIVSPAEARSLPRATGSVTFEQVGFSYDGQHAALDGISFHVEPGTCVAIVGGTGAGKTTLLSLIPRLYDPTHGRVLIDGIDVRDYDLDDLRRNVGIVFQESFLFSHTVSANIAFGRPEASSVEIESAAKMSAAHDFVEDFAEQYETIIGEYGSNLSGGQRQRLAIARALLLQPPILLLDDATTAIDPETEHEILTALEQAMQGRTTFVVAHRLSTLRRADRILVLDHGRLVQQGTHEELLRVAGHYRDSALAQMLDGEDQRIADAVPARSGDPI